MQRKTVSIIFFKPFAGMPAKDIRIMNIATGSAVCVIIFLLGFNLVLKKIKT